MACSMPLLARFHIYLPLIFQQWFNFWTRILGMLFVVGVSATLALAVIGLLLYIAVHFRSPSVDMHMIDIHHSIAPSWSSKMLHEGSPRRHTTLLFPQPACLCPYPLHWHVACADLAFPAKWQWTFSSGLLNIKWIMHQGIYQGALCTVWGISPLVFTRCSSLIVPRPSKANWWHWTPCTQIYFEAGL